MLANMWKIYCIKSDFDKILNFYRLFDLFSPFLTMFHEVLSTSIYVKSYFRFYFDLWCILRKYDWKYFYDIFKNGGSWKYFVISLLYLLIWIVGLGPVNNNMNDSFYNSHISIQIKSKLTYMQFYLKVLKEVHTNTACEIVSSIKTLAVRWARVVDTDLM